jgi:mono/diheme cytochrome c family protein
VNQKMIAWAAALLIGLGLSACTSHTERPPAAQATQMTVDGHQIYVEYCAECHQTDGQGWNSLYPRLAGNPIVTLHDPEPIIDTVLYGQGSMMPFNQRLDPNEVAAVLTYIRNSWGNHATPVSPREVH